MVTELSYQMKWAWSITEHQRNKLLLYMLIGVLSIGLCISFVYWTKQTIDLATAGSKQQIILVMCWTVSSIVLSLLFGLMANWLNGRTVRDIFVKLQNSLLKKQMNVGTIRQNLQIDPVENDDKELREALICACAEFVNELPDGIDTYIGEGGHGLSEGQAQRIAVARMLMRDSDIWLLDEITAGLDIETGKNLVDKLLNRGEDKLILFVTHDSYVAEQCSKAIFI